MFQPVHRSRASGEIVSQIERAIFATELSPGDRLQSERELAEQFGVSRITVRDALRVLEARGLIRVKVGAMGGAFVADANTDRVAESISTLIRLKRMTLSELAEARKIVEAATAELAAQRADAAAVSRLQQNVDRARPLLREPTVEAYRQLLVPSIRDLRDDKSGRATQKAHEEIVEAVRRHDPEGAREIMLNHLADFEKRLRRSLSDRTETEQRPTLAPKLVRTVRR